MGVKQPWHVHRTALHCQQQTDDRRLFIALSVQPCLQHDERDAARRADASAVVEICFGTTGTSDNAECIYKLKSRSAGNKDSYSRDLAISRPVRSTTDCWTSQRAIYTQLWPTGHVSSCWTTAARISEHGQRACYGPPLSPGSRATLCYNGRPGHVGCERVCCCFGGQLLTEGRRSTAHAAPTDLPRAGTHIRLENRTSRPTRLALLDNLGRHGQHSSLSCVRPSATP